MNAVPLIPIVAIVAGLSFAGVCVYFAYRKSRLQHEERIMALEKGVDIPVFPKEEELTPAEGRLRELKKGLIWLAVGLGMFFFFGMVYYNERDSAPVLGLGAVPTLIGIAHIVMYSIRSRQAADKGGTGTGTQHEPPYEG